MDNKIYKAVNWNTLDNDYVEAFWEQNLRQFWIDTEYIPSKDIDSWHSLSPEMREAYKKVLIYFFDPYHRLTYRRRNYHNLNMA